MSGATMTGFMEEVAVGICRLEDWQNSTKTSMETGLLVTET